MKLILNQIRKDVRLLKWVFAGWMLVVVLFHVLFLVATVSAPDNDQINRLSAAWTTFFVLGIGGLLVLAALIVQQDSPTSTTAFWLTRPLSPKAMVTSKVTLAFAALLLVPLALNIVDHLVTGVPLTSFVLVAAAFQLAWLLSALAIAAVTTGLPQFFLVVVFEIVGFIGVVGAANTLGIRVPEPDMPAILAVVSLLGAAVLAHSYLARRPRVTAVMIALAPVLIFIGLSPERVQSVPQRPLQYVGPEYKGPLSVTIDPSSFNVVRDQANRYIAVDIPLTTSGLPDGSTIAPERSTNEAWIETADTRIQVRVSRASSEGGGDAQQRRDAVDMRLSQVLGSAILLNPEIVPIDLPRLQLEIPAKLFDEKIGKRPFSLHFKFGFIVWGYRTVASARPTPGTTFKANDSRLRITRAVPDLRAATVALSGVSAETSMRMARLFSSFPLWYESTLYVLRNAPKAEAVVAYARPERQPFAGNGAAVLLPLPCDLAVTWSVMDFDLRRSSVSSRDWLNEADLVVVSQRRVGHVTKTFDVQNLTFPERTR